MKNAAILILLLTACNPGQSKNTDEDVISTWEWEPGAESPKIASGEVWCEMSDAGFHVFFLDVNANDPQGASDLDEGTWSAFAPDVAEALVTDALYCDGQECIYSFHAEQHLDIPCQLIQDFVFVAEIFDYSGNSTGEFELDVLPPPE
jgi:hypothetical protein